MLDSKFDSIVSNIRKDSEATQSAAKDTALPLHMIAGEMQSNVSHPADSMQMEGVPGGPSPPVIDVGAVMIALQQLEMHTSKR